MRSGIGPRQESGGAVVAPRAPRAIRLVERVAGGEAGADDPFEIGEIGITRMEQKAEGVPARAGLLRGHRRWPKFVWAALSEVDREEREGLLAWLGIYGFDCDEAHAAPSLRGATLPHPIPVDVLPAHHRGHAVLEVGHRV